MHSKWKLDLSEKLNFTGPWNWGQGHMTMTDWHVHLRMKPYTKYQRPTMHSSWEPDLIRKLNQVTGLWNWGQGQLTMTDWHVHPRM